LKGAPAGGFDVASEPLLTSNLTNGRLALAATGAWTAAHADAADRLVHAVPVADEAPSVTVDVAGITALDTFGAWLLERLLRGAQDRGQQVELVGLPARFQGLVSKVHEVNRQAPHPSGPHGMFARAGAAVERFSASFEADAASFLVMLGAIWAALIRVILRPRHFRLTSAVHQLDRVGWKAVGIIFLITFLIGGIIAQQGIFHFRRFGAEDYVVDLVGILVLRELGVLIVAIMVAGRSGSSYTAELGSMKMREEIDALRTMGLDPVEILILPRVIALVVALPVLAFLGAMAALIGGGLVTWVYGGMSPAVFVVRLHEAVTVTHFEVGMIKAPFMALVIGVVAAAEGLRVKGSAESLGLQTTTSVVKSIFLVIVLDGVFAVFFASIGM
jgi:phospholipid/cholesterol/gamma-HCH transport system permease protein